MRKLWLQWRSSLWFIPALLVLAGIGCAIALIELDSLYAGTFELQRWRPFVNASPEGAREMLGAIASSAITVAGVAFSVTVVTLSLASTQYTPRILRNFMRDPANQWVLGSFVGIFAYCLIVLRTVYASDETRPAFVPLISVTFAVMLALLAIGCLIFFIHHTAASIQASHILETICNETIAVIRQFCPKDNGDDLPAPVSDPQQQWHPHFVDRAGYLQHVNVSVLTAFVERQGSMLRLDRRIGEFVMPGIPLFHSTQPLPDEQRSKLLQAFVVGDFRTVDQDPSFGVRQIVDIALKALSPGINDTSTAVSCLDYLGTILGEIGGRRLLSPLHCAPGAVFSPVVTFEDLASKSFDEIRDAARGNVSVLRHLLCVAERLFQVLPSKHHAVLLRHAQAVTETANRSVPDSLDREQINRALRDLAATAGTSPGQLRELTADSGVSPPGQPG